MRFFISIKSIIIFKFKNKGKIKGAILMAIFWGGLAFCLIISLKTIHRGQMW